MTKTEIKLLENRFKDLDDVKYEPLQEARKNYYQGSWKKDSNLYGYLLETTSIHILLRFYPEPIYNDANIKELIDNVNSEYLLQLKEYKDYEEARLKYKWCIDNITGSKVSNIMKKDATDRMKYFQAYCSYISEMDTLGKTLQEKIIIKI